VLWVAGGVYGGTAGLVDEPGVYGQRGRVADLRGAGGNWVGAGVQRAGGECDAAQPGAEGTLCKCGDVGRDDLSDWEHVGAGGGWAAVYAAADGTARPVERGFDRVCVHAADAAGLYRAGVDD